MQRTSPLATPQLTSQSDARKSAASSKQLSRLILAAWQRVPFYAQHWSTVGSRLPVMVFPEQLSELPLVAKSDLLAHPIVDLLDRNYGNRGLTVEKTSGSSGQPIEMYKDAGSTRRRSLRFLRALLACGYRPGRRLLSISTRRTAGLMSFARWQYVDLRDDDLLREYQQARPDVLYGPLTSLLQICEHAGSATPLHRPSIVISTAEQLMPAQRALLEAKFGCPVADFYGMTEVGLIAFRRPGSATYELASDDLLLEFVPLADDATAERLIVTDIAGGAMPLIRYDTGDLVHRDASDRGTIREFVGRQVDSLKLGSGRTLSPYRVTLCLEAIARIRQYQVVQRKDMTLDVYFNTDEQHTDAVRRSISTGLADLCGDLPVRIHFQKQALHIGAGKFRPVQSELRTSP
jgi:phenylacetate-CoA ligase